MTEASEWHDLMAFTVVHRPFTSRDGYGAPSYGAGTNRRAHISYKPVKIRMPDGSEVVAKGTIILGDKAAVDPQDQIVLPDGSTPIILNVSRFSDESDWHHTTVYIG